MLPHRRGGGVEENRYKKIPISFQGRFELAKNINLTLETPHEEREQEEFLSRQLELRNARYKIAFKKLLHCFSTVNF